MTQDNVDQAMNLLLMQGAVYAPPSSAVIATRIAATRVFFFLFHFSPYEINLLVQLPSRANFLLVYCSLFSHYLFFASQTAWDFRPKAALSLGMQFALFSMIIVFFNVTVWGSFLMILIRLEKSDLDLRSVREKIRKIFHMHCRNSPKNLFFSFYSQTYCANPRHLMPANIYFWHISLLQGRPTGLFGNKVGILFCMVLSLCFPCSRVKKNL